MLENQLQQQDAANRADDPDTLLSTKDAAVELRLRPNTLEIWRFKGIGPPYVKIGRSVRYIRRDLRDYVVQHKVAPRAPHRKS